MITIAKLFDSLVLVTGIVAIGLLQQPRWQQLEHSNIDTKSLTQEIQKEQNNLSFWKRFSAFGYGNLLADWFFLRFIQYYGDDTARDKTGYELNPQFLELIIKYDPKFVPAYLIFSSAISIDAAMPDKSIELLGQGLKHISPYQPDANYVWLYRATDQILFTNDVEGARYSYNMAADWADIALNHRLAKANRKTAQYISNHPYSKKNRIAAWQLILTHNRFAKTRQVALNKIRELGGTIKIQPNGAIVIASPKDN